MSSDPLHPPAPAGWSPGRYAARSRHGETVLGLGGTALCYALILTVALWRWIGPPVTPTSRPAPALAVFDVPPASPVAAERPQRATSQNRATPRHSEPPRPVPPPPLVPRAASMPVAAAPTSPAPPDTPDRTAEPAATVASASAAPAAARPTTGRTASAERAARANWQGDILAHLRPLLRYPRIAERDGQQGTAIIALAVDRQGIVHSARIVRGSGYPALDGEALATVKRGSPLPPPTPDIAGDPVSVELPIQFSLHG